MAFRLYRVGKKLSKKCILNTHLVIWIAKGKLWGRGVRPDRIIADNALGNKHSIEGVFMVKRHILQ